MATVEQTRQRVHSLLTGPMRLRVDVSEESFVVGFDDASTRLTLSIVDWGVTREGSSRTLIRLSAPILRSVAPTPELFEWIARAGSNFLFGHVVVYDEQNEPGKVILLMTHALLGDHLDEDELGAAMWGVLGGADDLDETLQKRFGGRRFSDEPAGA